MTKSCFRAILKLYNLQKVVGPFHDDRGPRVWYLDGDGFTQSQMSTVLERAIRNE